MPATVSPLPNVLFIISDDHGYADRSLLGTRDDIRTPHLDELACNGTSFSDAYVTAPICSPSRAGLIAGCYQERWGAQWFGDSEFPGAKYQTIPEQLHRVGYTNGYFGKVHYGTEGPGDRGTPPHHGFDESFYGLAGQSMGRLNYLHHSARAQSEYGPEASMRMGVQPLWENDQPVEYEGFLTDEIARRARNFIAHNADRPFFTMVAFNAVHNFCWQLPPDELRRRGLPAFEDWHPGESQYLDWYDGAISPNLPDGRSYYVAQLELMDAAIGDLIDELRKQHIIQNTIIIYTTDNGGSTCNYGVNEPLRGTKYTLWEGGIKVPLIVSWPGITAPGTTTRGLVSTMDILPTLVEAAGSAPSGHIDGESLIPLLKGSRGGHEELYWDCGWQWAIRRGDWKLHYVAPDSETARSVLRVEHTDPGAGMRLTNLSMDPSEDSNVMASHPALVRDLRNRYESWKTSLT